MICLAQSVVRARSNNTDFSDDAGYDEYGDTMNYSNGSAHEDRTRRNDRNGSYGHNDAMRLDADCIEYAAK